MKYYAVIATLLAAASLAAASNDILLESTHTDPSWRPNPIDSSAAPIISVTVGADSQLRFDPPFINGVGQGQRIHFDFRALNHTLTESSFERPCAKSPDALIDTDFNNANPDDIPNFKPFDTTLESDEPRFFYCKQGKGTPNSHCAQGMVFAINVDEDDFNVFVQNAAVEDLPKIRGRAPAVNKAN